MPSFVITRLDHGPAELAQLLPLRARLVRVIPGADRPDYLLCHLERFIPFRPPVGYELSRVRSSYLTEDSRGTLIAVQALVICTRIAGGRFRVGMRDVAVNIAYVIDSTLLTDVEVDFAKLEFVAIGSIDDSPTDVLLPGESE